MRVGTDLGFGDRAFLIGPQGRVVDMVEILDTREVQGAPEALCFLFNRGTTVWVDTWDLVTLREQGETTDDA